VGSAAGALRISLITDAWLPQVNGVTTTLSRCCAEMADAGHQIQVVHPGLFRTVRCPRYEHIRLAVWPGRRVSRLLDQHQAQAIHIATEGPLGLAGRRYCVRRGLPFTTSLHTRFPEYLSTYLGVPTALTYRLMRWFHGRAVRTLVPTASIKKELEDRGFDGIVQWLRGVDTALFKPGGASVYSLPRPIFVYAGRVAVEKNLGAFLELDLPGSKVIVGDGPARAALQAAHPEVHWAGFRFGKDLARHYADADVFVFPSRTDTFGIVMLEANACGLPVAAYPVPGPVDVVREGVNGVLSDDLRAACLAALDIDPLSCRRLAETFSWRRCAEMLFDSLAVIDLGGRNACNLRHARPATP
jgi:glycosyltransferase involved in cell wall biosynthesis